MCIKVDVSKAFDSVNWDYLFAALQVLNFLLNTIQWIKECVCELKFSVLLNGSLCGFFASERGLRHGCPISPYLFCICMEFSFALLK